MAKQNREEMAVNIGRVDDTKPADTAKGTKSAKTAKNVNGYSAAELVNAARTRFKCAPEAVGAALKMASVTSCSFDDAVSRHEECQKSA